MFSEILSYIRYRYTIIIAYVKFLGYHSSWSLSGEQKLEDQLDGLVFLAQEWHKKRVSTPMSDKILFVSSCLILGGPFHFQ